MPASVRRANLFCSVRFDTDGRSISLGRYEIASVWADVDVSWWSSLPKPEIERQQIMSKPLLIVILIVTGTALWTDSAEARWRRGWNNRTNSWYSNSACSTYTSVTMTTSAPTVMMSQPGATVVQSNTTPGYQSYSYEPDPNYVQAGVNPAIDSAVMARAPGTSRTNAFEYNNVLRGDRKVRGHTAEGE